MRQARHARKRIQRAFHAWLFERRSTLPLQLVVAESSHNVVRCRIQGVCSNISIVLTYDLSIVVERNGEFWDMLSSFECIPEHADGGYVCALCVEDHPVFYPSREQFWRERLFEPMASWLGRLALARWLLLYEIDGMAWARLLGECKHESIPASNLVEAVRIHGDGL